MNPCSTAAALVTLPLCVACGAAERTRPAIAPYQAPAASAVDVLVEVDDTAQHDLTPMSGYDQSGEASVTASVGIAGGLYLTTRQAAAFDRNVAGQNVDGAEDLSVAAGWLGGDDDRRIRVEAGTNLATGVAPLSEDRAHVTASAVAARAWPCGWAWVDVSARFRDELETSALSIGGSLEPSYQHHLFALYGELGARQRYGAAPDLDPDVRLIGTIAWGNVLIGLRGAYTEQEIDAVEIGVVVGVRSAWASTALR